MHKNLEYLLFNCMSLLANRHVALTKSLCFSERYWCFLLGRISRLHQHIASYPQGHGASRSTMTPTQRHCTWFQLIFCHSGSWRRDVYPTSSGIRLVVTSAKKLDHYRLIPGSKTLWMAHSHLWMLQIHMECISYSATYFKKQSLKLKSIFQSTLETCLINSQRFLRLEKMSPNLEMEKWQILFLCKKNGLPLTLYEYWFPNLP